MSLFDLIGPPQPKADPNWRVEMPPEKFDGSIVYLDFESTGKRWWPSKGRPGDVPIGASLWCPIAKKGWYLPWGHRGDGSVHNVDEGLAKEYLRRALHGKTLINAGSKFDIHMALNWGLDLESIVLAYRDIAHTAALLDDHRRRFNQDQLLQDFLPDSRERKAEVVDGIRLDPSRMAQYHPRLVGGRAITDVRQVYLLWSVMFKRLSAEALIKIQKLEDECAWATVEMERNGCPVDEEKLDLWIRETADEMAKTQMEIWRGTGVKFLPDKADSWAALLKVRGIQAHTMTAGGKLSIAEDALKPFFHDEVIRKAWRVEKLADLRSKYLLKYKKALNGTNGILRYALHQLRGDEGGTVSGRYSSAGLEDDTGKVGGNIQQVIDPDKQVKKYEDRWIIKELMGVNTADEETAAVDAEQIEYRIFADAAQNPRIIEAYAKDPWTKFHHLTWGWLKPFKPAMLYKEAKNLNFMNIYGGGMVKLAVMLEYMTEKRGAQLMSEYANRVPRTHPELAEALVVKELYERELPEVPILTKKYIAMAEQQGWVATKDGRRSRFPKGERAHKAFNAYDQGTAADINKKKLCELRRARKEGRIEHRLIATVHDEVLAALPKKPEALPALLSVLNEQTTPMSIPILWAGKAGPNWAYCKAKD